MWVAKYDLDPAVCGGGQQNLYAGRGLLTVSERGVLWLYGTAVEHHVLYKYQLVNTRDIIMGQIQTETAYYQPNPNARIPFPAVAALSDPTFPGEFVFTNNTNIPNADGWGLRILDSDNVVLYGTGLYSFFNSWSTTCSAIGQGARCQTHVLEITNSEVSIYDLHTVGSHWMVYLNGENIALWEDNDLGFPDEIIIFRTCGDV